MKRSNSIIGTEIIRRPEDQEPIGIMFTVKGAGVVSLQLSKIHADNLRHAAIHGMIQRISDAAAISRNPETGAAASPEAKLEAMQKLVAHYESGTAEWTRVREAGPKGGLLFEALVRMGNSAEEVREFLDGLSDKEQAALREDSDVAPIIAQIKAEKAKADTGPKPDTKAMLASLKK